MYRGGEFIKSGGILVTGLVICGLSLADGSLALAGLGLIFAAIGAFALVALPRSRRASGETGRGVARDR